MLTVLHIIQILSLGGASRSLIASAKYTSLIGEQQKHIVLSLKPAQHEAIKLANREGVGVISQPSSSQICQAIKAADIVHLHFWNSPEILEFLRLDLPEMRLLVWLKILGEHPPHIISKELIQYADFILATSVCTLELPVFKNLSPEIKTQKTGVVYGIADLDRVCDIQPRPHPTFNIGYIGTVNPVKMHSNYISMSAAVEIPNIRFIVCGDGNFVTLQKQAKQLQADERFEFRGYVEDIKSVLEVLDIFGYPLCQDTYATSEKSLQEAMYAGIPAIVFPYGGVKQLIIDQETGLVVNSELEYKQAIEYLYHHPEERLRLGKNAQDYAINNFCAEKATRQIHKIYKRLMARPKRQRVWEFPPIYLHQGQKKSITKGAESFIQSLANQAPQFEQSLRAQNLRDLWAADQKISRSTPVLCNQYAGGILHYRDYYRQDCYLRFWSGLVLQYQEKYQEAITQFQAAIKLKFDHWRIGLYLASSAEKIGNQILAQNYINAALQKAEDLKLAQEMLNQLRDFIPTSSQELRQPLAEQVDCQKPEPSLSSASNVGYSSKLNDSSPFLSSPAIMNAEKIKTIFPKILPVNSESNRPLFSVMIPTFNKVKYLEETLKSVIEQGFPPEEMQIEVINDCPDSSVQGELEAIVNRVGRNRIKFYRCPQQNIGQINIFNLCLQRAQGYWIHLLHDDDFVLPGFYQSLRKAIEQTPNIGAAFCRHYYIDENSRQRSLSVLERETPGLLENWLECIAISQRIQPSSIIVRRTTYEHLGGFCKEARSAADWEMWKRIATYFPIWYEPKALACYRLHSISWTSCLLQTGENIFDTLKAIEVSQSYLPANQVETLSKQAREHYAFYAVNTAKQMLGANQEKTAIAQIKAALKCSQSQQLKDAILELFSPEKLEYQDFKLNEILIEVTSLSEQYRQNNLNKINLEKLRNIREKFAQLWLNTASENLESLYIADGGKIHKVLLNCGIKNESLTEIERATVNEWINYLSQGMNQSHALQNLLAIMLYVDPHHLPSQWYQQAPIPKWFVNDYLIFMLATPEFFKTKGEAQRYYLYLKDWVSYLHSRIFSEPNSKIWQDIANLFLHRANFIPLYFNSENLKDLYIKRAEIFELALKSQGHQLNYILPERPKKRSKIRLGILSSHFNPQTETYATLPVFEYLDRTQFEIILYACQANNHALEQYCQSRTDQFIKLSKNLEEQVKTIRADDLDILLIGTNVTAVTHSVTLLALHRLARIQVASTPSCVTTGMQNIDYYISGNLTEPPEIAPTQYREQLVTIAGPAHCFSYAESSSQQQTIHPQRSELGISENTVMFISGANFYKIIPELRETWAKILSQVPNSVLVLYPFNPNWTSNYAKIPFLKNLQAVFASYGIDPQRLIILDTQRSRADIKAYLKLADIYLDSYPFSGVTSLVDPLEVGLVPVTKNGNSFRSQMGAALLKSLALNSLITTDEETYINLAVQLALTPDLRQKTQQQIQQKMQQNPSFLDSQTYSSKIEVVLKQLFQNWQSQHKPKNSIELETLSGKRDFLAELVSYINLYDINPFTHTLVEHLRDLRKVLADYWLKIPPHQLKEVYQDHMGQGYQILLHRGIQKEPLTQAEQKFVDELTQVATGLQHPNSLNCLMAAMLYYVPGKILVRDADQRLPQWLINDYKAVFENQERVKKVQQSTQAMIDKKSTQSSLSQAFKNQVLGCVNLYRIDSTNESVIEELRHIRHNFAQFWLSLASTQLESIYKSSVGEAYKSLLKSGFQQQSLTEAEQQFLQQLTTQLSQGFDQPQSLNYFLAVLLYSHLEQLTDQEISQLPPWLQKDLLQ